MAAVFVAKPLMTMLAAAQTDDSDQTVSCVWPLPVQPPDLMQSADKLFVLQWHPVVGLVDTLCYDLDC